jgi:hypothetical protein
VRNDSDSRKLKKGGKPLCGRDVGGHASAKESADESQHPEFARGKPTLGVIATQTLAVLSRHEMPRTRHAGWFDQKLPIGAYRLKAMMFDHDRFTKKKCKDERCKGWTCKVDNIAVTDESPKSRDTWLANDSKRKHGVIETARCSLRGDSQFKMLRTARGTKVRQSSSEAQHNGFHASNTRCKKVRID